MIAVNVLHGIKPIEVEGEIYALKKGDSAYIPSKLAGAMITRGWAAEIAPTEKDDQGKDNSAVEEVIEKEAEKLSEELKEEEINGTAPIIYEDLGWTSIKEGIVENSQATGYKRSVKLEQNGSLFRIIVAGCYPLGYTTEAEAIEIYEWLREVR